MKIEIETGLEGLVNRRVNVTIRSAELASVTLSIAFPAERNRTSLYMRRHSRREDYEANITVGPNAPLRALAEPPKLLISEHLEQIRRCGSIPPLGSDVVSQGSERFRLQPAMIAVPVSDLVANLLRPCFSVQGLGNWRLFFLEDEPIGRKTYWTVCLFGRDDGRHDLKFREVRFDRARDTVLGVDGSDLLDEGLDWAVALVSLVKHSKAVSALEIAKNDYDLRQLFGRQAEIEIGYAYDGWFDEWDARVERLLNAYVERGEPYSVFYHSILGVDESGSIRIVQMDGELPQIAQALAAKGFVAAGLMDSGGSCALFDPWLGGYLNHGWYFREPRGAVLVFETIAQERIPESKANSWFRS